MTQPHRKSRPQGGFTLVEIMVVILIIGLIASIVGTNVVGQFDDAQIDTAKANTTQLYQNAKYYRVKNNRVPTLEDLTTPDARGNVAWEGETADPWGNEYIIRELDGHLRFEVISMGPDGLEDTEDDLVAPKRRDD